jgi:epithelial splicing regulatory protein 1/2
MKSLPFDATQLDVIQFFDGFKLKPNGVQLVVRSDNKPTGEVRAPPRAAGLERRAP